MKPAFAIICAVALVSCTKQSAQEEKRFKIVEVSGDPAAKCGQAKKVRDAYLQENNGRQYEVWDLNANLACQEADLKRIAGE